MENRAIIGTSGETGVVTITANIVFNALTNNDAQAFTGEVIHRAKITVDVNGSVVKKNIRKEFRQRVEAGLTALGPQTNHEFTVATESCIEIDGSLEADGRVTVAPFAVKSALFDGSGIISSFSCAAP